MTAVRLYSRSPKEEEEEEVEGVEGVEEGVEEGVGLEVELREDLEVCFKMVCQGCGPLGMTLVPFDPPSFLLVLEVLVHVHLWVVLAPPHVSPGNVMALLTLHVFE